MVVEVAKLLRSFIIEMSKQARSNNGRTSKQAKLYEHLTSAEYARTMNIIIDKKSKLDELQRNEESYHKKTWNSRTKLIEDWFKVDQHNQHLITEIIQNQTHEHAEDNLDDENE